MNPNLQPYSNCHCQSPNFASVLRKFNLRIGHHQALEDQRSNGLISCLSFILARDQNEINEAIERKKNDRDFKSLASVEVGRNFLNSSIVTSNSVLARLGAISHHFDKPIYLFCDALTLNSIHKGSQLIVLNPSVETDLNSSIACVCTEGNYFHPVMMTNLPIIEPFQTINYNGDHTEDNVEADIIDQNHILNREIEFVNGQDEDEGEVFSNEDMGDINENQNVADEEEEVEEPDENEILTIDEFLLLNFENNDPRRINDASYTSRCKLDFVESAISTDRFSIQRTFDIDGFFGFLEFEELIECLNCSIQFNVFPTQVDPKTRKNINSMLQRPQSTNFNCFNYGKIDLSHSSINLIMMFMSSININQSVLNDAVLRATEVARSLPCSQDPLHFNSCPSRSVRDAHRSTMRATARTHTKVEYECYSKVVAECYLYHFKKQVLQELAYLNAEITIECFFKSIGSKSGLRESDVYEAIRNLNEFGSALTLEKLNPEKTFIDFCVAATSTCDGPVGKVFKFKIKTFLL